MGTIPIQPNRVLQACEINGYYISEKQLILSINLEVCRFFFERTNFLRLFSFLVYELFRYITTVYFKSDH